jgi:valyl-tRNA synthetase
MDSLYDPSGVERRWQETWEAEGLYGAGVGRRRDDSFVICVPPPNVTGELHMGHALNGAMQDVLVRWHRMRGFDTLWQPGYDHAGISTQNVVEKQLVAEGTGSSGRDAPSWASTGVSARRSTTRASGSRWTTSTSGR